MFESILQDVKIAFQVFAKAPGFTAIVILTLAVAIGTNTGDLICDGCRAAKALAYPDTEKIVRRPGVVGPPQGVHTCQGQRRPRSRWDRPAHRRYFSSTKIAAPEAVRMSVSAATPSRLALSRTGPPGSFAGCHQLVLCHSSSGV